MTTTQPPVVHDLQFGTYSSPHTARGRHGSWPLMGGLTHSHHRLAGAWLRLGDRSYWCCLQRQWRPSVRTVTPRVDSIRPPLPANLPPARTEPPGAGARVRRVAAWLVVRLVKVSR
jgi:hypothetical protein